VGIAQKSESATVAFRETLWLALDTLRAHKLRSFLTLLGVILAVTTLVAVMSVVEGLNRYVADRIANLGANVFIVNQFGIITSFEEFMRARRRPPIRMEDYEYVKGHLEYASQVGAADDARTDVRYGNEILEQVLLMGVTGNFAELRAVDAALGRTLNENDDTHRAPVCFIGKDVADRFFPTVDPIGKTIRVGSQTYEVVGVAKEQGSVFGQSRDGFVWIPLGAYLKHWFRGNDSIFILVQAARTEWMEPAQAEVRAILRARRKVPYAEPDNFGIIAPTSITSLWERLTGNIFQVAVGLTSVFLVVGGIVIMNIMLASVTERTREIGIRKSLGARRRHIVMQFLVESALLAAIGGMMGILAAMGIGALVRATTPMPIVTPLNAVVISLLLSTSVGLFFGIYPAVRAARLDPIEALRAET
jgi:putative ABC transport system permease protein